MKTLTTPNMLEVGYLLERHHQIIAVNTHTAWPYGVEELAITLAGENIDLDHHNFMRHGVVELGAVVEALGQVQSAIAQALEAI